MVGEEEEEDEDEEATHEEEEEEEEEDESNGEEEYDEDYGPPATQTSQASQLPKKKDLLSPDPFQRPVPRRPKKKIEEHHSKSNEDRTFKRGRSN